MAATQEVLSVKTQMGVDEISRVVKNVLQRYGVEDDNIRVSGRMLAGDAVGFSRDRKHWRVYVQVIDSGAEREVEVTASGDTGGRKVGKFLKTYFNSGADGFWDIATGHGAQTSGMVSLSSSLVVAQDMVNSLRRR